MPEAIVVGSGPNGLAAAIGLAEAGWGVTVYEARDALGGGASSASLTLPGFVHDVCSAVHPMAVDSACFRSLPLATYGLEWVEPSAMLAHPFDDGSAAVVDRSVDTTAAGLGPDGSAYKALIGTVVADWPRLESTVLGPIGWPAHPLVAARFGFKALQPAASLLRRTFRGEPARALVAGIAAHGMLPLSRPATAAFGLVLGSHAHTAGWLFPRGGAQRLTDALAAHLRALGGRILTGAPVDSIETLPPVTAVLCDLSPRPFLKIAGRRLTPRFRRALERYRYGCSVFKVDWALEGPIPWRAPACRRAGTLHLGGTLAEIEAAEASAWSDRPAERPFVLLAQPTIADPTRAPPGRHVAWAYCHVPHGSTVDMRERIEAQVERFAPGFGARILARVTTSPAAIEARNPNMVGGDIGAGASTLGQLFTRPTWRQYATSARGLYLCSAATPPGVGVHGLCGYFAARRVLRDFR
jgi:phytoene dehydrogenase-like protein